MMNSGVMHIHKAAAGIELESRCDVHHLIISLCLHGYKG